MKKKIVIAIYTRKSKFSDKGESCANQEDLIREYIRTHYPSSEYAIEIKVYEEEGKSGKDFKRKHFQEMMQVERITPFYAIIVYRLDRISRNIADFSNMINELISLNTHFISIKEQFDTSTPMGRAMMYIASVFAQLEREVIAERVRDNMLELAKTGIWLGGDPPLGFANERYYKVDICENKDEHLVKKRKQASKLVINEKEVITVKLIFSKFLELKSLSKLETYLMNNNIKTRKNAYYSAFALKWILTNPVYAQNDKDMKEYFNSIGIDTYAEDDGRELFDGSYSFLTYNKTNNRKKNNIENWIIAVGLHRGLLTGKQWIAVQRLLEKNSDKRYRSAGYLQKQTIASGLIRCKECGSYMRPRNMDKRRADGTVNYRYYCILKEKSRRHMCNCKNVAGEELDNKIIDIIKNTFVPNSAIYNELKNMTIPKTIKDDDDDLKILESEYLKKENEINNIIKRLAYIDVDLIDVINENLGKLKREKEEVEQKIFELKTNKTKLNNDSSDVQTAKNILKIIDNSLNNFELYDLKTKRDIAGLLIESIYGGGEDIEINFWNTNITDSHKKMFFLPTLTKVDNFLDNDLPTDSTSVNRH